MTSNKQSFAHLRRLLSQQPSKESFKEIFALFQEWDNTSPDLELGIDYASTYLQSWPNDLRFATLEDFWPSFPEDKPSKAFSLVRHLKVNPERARVSDKSNPFSRITHLDLSNSNSNPMHTRAVFDIKEIQAVAKLTSLTTLNLNHNNIRNEEVQALTKLTNLTNLYLSDSNLNDKGVIAISTLNNLTTLDLSNNSIYLEGYKALSKLTSLSTLNLRSAFRSLNEHGDEPDKKK